MAFATRFQVEGHLPGCLVDIRHTEQYTLDAQGQEKVTKGTVCKSLGINLLLKMRIITLKKLLRRELGFCYCLDRGILAEGFLMG